MTLRITLAMACFLACANAPAQTEDTALSLSITPSLNSFPSTETHPASHLNAAQTADARLHSLKTAVDITAHIAEHSLDTVNLKNYGVSLASLDITWRTPEQRNQLDTFMQKHLREVQQAFGNVADYTAKRHVNG